MNTETKKKLGDMFIDSDDGLRRCFRLEDMTRGSENYPIYSAISDAMCESDLSHNFAYTIAEIACDILSEVDWNNEDDITEAVDQAVPIYTGEVMEIYASDSWIVDEAVKEMGDNEMESEARAKIGWYKAISEMVQAIREKLSDETNEQ